jgi:hypothetical protein
MRLARSGEGSPHLARDALEAIAERCSGVRLKWRRRANSWPKEVVFSFGSIVLQ